MTPFSLSGEVDEDALAGVASWTADHGAHGLLVNGSTGEYATQTFEERKRVLEVVLDTVGDRVPVMVNVTSARVPEAIALAEHATQAGAVGLLLSAPGLVRPTTPELVRYFDTVLAASPLPACVYNFPQESGHGLSIDEVSLLADLPTVVAIKQASPDLRDTLQALDRCGDRIRVFGHFLSPLGVSLLKEGLGDGYIGSAMLFGAAQPGFFRLVAEGQYEKARQEALRIEHGMGELLGPRPDGYNWAFGGMQSTIKAAMTLQGVPAGLPRAPRLPLDQTQTAALAETLAELGLLPSS